MKRLIKYKFVAILLLNTIISYSQNLDSLKTHQLDSVVVTALKNNRTSSNGKITYTINNSIYANLGFSMDVLKYIPEIQFDGNKITIKQRPTALFIDGFEVNKISNSIESALAGIASNEIDRIEIISNPSSNYQSNVFTVVKIWTVKMKEIGWQYNFNAQYGKSKNWRTLDGFKITKNSKKHTLFIGLNNYYNRYDTDYSSRRSLTESKLFYNDTALQKVKYNNFGVTAGLNLRFDSTTTLHTNLRYMYATRKRNDNYSSQITDGNNYAENYFTKNWQMYTEYNFDNKFVKKTSSGEFYINSYITNHDNIYTDNTEIRETGKRLFMPSKGLINIYNQSTGFIKRTNKNELEIGIGLSNEVQRINASYFQDGVYNNAFSSVYRYKVVNKYSFFSFIKKYKSSNFNLGLRYENINLTANEETNKNDISKVLNLFIPKVSYNITLKNGNDITFNFSKYTNPPDFFSLGKRLSYYSPVAFKRGNQLLLPAITNLFEMNYVVSPNISFSTSFVKEKNREVEIPLIENTNTVFVQMENSENFNIGMLDLTLSKEIGKFGLIGYFQAWKSTNFFKEYKSSSGGGLVNIQCNVSLGKFGQLGGMYYLSSKNRTDFINSVVVKYLDLNYSKLLKNNLNLTLIINDVFNTNILGFEYNTVKLSKYDFYKYETRIFKIGLSYKFGNKNINEYRLLKGNKKINI